MRKGLLLFSPEADQVFSLGSKKNDGTVIQETRKGAGIPIGIGAAIRAYFWESI
jgi:hypothetical protein